MKQFLARIACLSLFMLVATPLVSSATTDQLLAASESSGIFDLGYDPSVVTAFEGNSGLVLSDLTINGGNVTIGSVQFRPGATVPECSTLCLAVLGSLCGVGYRRR